MKGILLVSFFLGGTLSGCASTFTKTGNYDAQPREAGCDFSIFTVTPTDPFKELGIISFYVGAGSPVHSISGAKEAAKEFVCKAGGDGLILPEPTKDGFYRRGTVILLKK